VGRDPRPQIPGGIYHLMTRGVRRTAIFRSPDDYRYFLALFGNDATGRGWRCFSYCLMPNHYHLLVETPNPDLSLGMHRLNSGFARWFNDGYLLVGHVFEARFRSVVVEEDEHLVEVARYLVMNPVRGGLCEQPAEWPWSSFRVMVGEQPAPPWFDAAFWHGVFGRDADPAGARRAFAAFVRAA
jgi:putative transposase